ncbi:MAG: NUDIX hydrolase [Rhizobiales bacterium PAR1]|nr:MAG: NUDIX hydrolase [Rhizobiales bacterium PAR1]
MSDPSAVQRPVLAASIAVFRDGKVLLAQRGKAPGLGLYSLPGGRIEPGETMREGALRELLEEVGLEAEILAFIDHVEHIERADDGVIRAHAVVAAFVGVWRGGEAILTDEASDVLWVDPLEPGDLPMTRGLPAILARAAHLVAGALP